MANQLRTLTIVGLALNIVGTLLPWGCGGDMPWYCVPGIGFPTAYIVHAQDNGGSLVLLLSLIVSLLIIYEPGFVKKPALFAMVLAAALMIAVIYHSGAWVIRGFETRGRIGADAPSIGLGVLFIGSYILLLTARRLYQMTAV